MTLEQIEKPITDYSLLLTWANPPVTVEKLCFSQDQAHTPEGTLPYFLYFDAIGMDAVGA